LAILFLVRQGKNLKNCDHTKGEIMYSSIRRANGKPGTVPEVIRKVKEGFVPIASSVPGFVAYYLVDIGNDSVMTVSIFQDKAGAEESGKRAADWVK
jgi:hypothetical protein